MTEEPRAARPAAADAIPPHVEDAVLTALEKLPADRFATAAEFAAAIAERRGRHHPATRPHAGAARGAVAGGGASSWLLP